MDRLLSIIFGVATLIGLFFSIQGRLWLELYPRLLLGGLTTAMAFLSCAFIYLYRLRNRTIPELINLKGACAVTNELQLVVTPLSDSEIRSAVASKLIKSLAIRAQNRIKDISSPGQPLDDAKIKLQKITESYSSIEPSQVKIILQEVHQIVHNFDRRRLRKAHLEHILYHPIADV